MPIQTNALIQAMLKNDFNEIRNLLNVDTKQDVLLPLSEDTKALLRDANYQITADGNENSVLFAFTYFWHQADVHSQDRASVLLSVLDIYHGLSPTSYFSMLMALAKQTEKNQQAWHGSQQGDHFSAIKKTVPALDYLATELKTRIKAKTYPTSELIAYMDTLTRVNWHDLPGYPVLNAYSEQAPGSIMSFQEHETIKVLMSRDSSVVERKNAVEALWPHLGLDKAETSLFSAMIQRLSFNDYDVKRPLGESTLEICYLRANQDTFLETSFHPVIAESRLLTYLYYETQDNLISGHNCRTLFLYSLEGLQAFDQANDDVREENYDHLEKRFDIFKRYYTNEKKKDTYKEWTTRLYQYYLRGKMLSNYRQPHVYPTWFIAAMLDSFKIDINRPYNNGDAPIVDWFKKYSPPLFKHLLSSKYLIFTPSDESVNTIIKYLESEIEEMTQPGNQPSASVARRKALQEKAAILAGELEDCDSKKNLMKVMQALKDLDPAPAPTITPTPAPLAPSAAPLSLADTQKPQTNVVEESQTLARHVVGMVNVDGGKNFLEAFKTTLEELYQAKVTDAHFAELIRLLTLAAEDDDLSKHEFSRLKNAINTYLISDTDKKEVIRKLMDASPDQLDDAAKKNYLLYVLALGRSKLKLHTQPGLFGKHNHFTALNDFLHDKPLNESTRQKFGLFELKRASSAESEKDKMKPRQRKFLE